MPSSASSARCSLGHPLRLLAALALLLPATALMAQTVDGTRDSTYGPPRAVQLAATGFGDNTDSAVLTANGSELDAAHAIIRDGHLHLFLAGNLETNFNKLEVFIDSAAGGQNQLTNTNPDVDLNGLNSMAGLTFDAGFAADYYFTLGGGDQGAGAGLEFFASFAKLGAGPAGYGAGTGAVTTLPADFTLPASTTGLVADQTIVFALNNSNTAGVTSTAVDGASAVTTGIEIKIPLALIGGTSAVKVCAFINNGAHTFVSNQVLGSLPASSANLGPPASVNFSTLAGEQFFTVPWQVTTTDDTGTGSLRQTIADAPAGSVITFTPGLAHRVITLGGELVVNKSLTLDASGLTGGLTLKANASTASPFRVLSVTSGASVTLDSLTLTGGVTTTGFGGAVLAEGNSLTLRRCLLTGNTASYGGGLAVRAGTARVEDSVIDGNVARSSSPVGGGIEVFQSTLQIVRSTVTDNRGFDTDTNTSGPVVSGGGIQVQPFASCHLENSIVAGNGPSNGGAGGDDIFGEVTSTAGKNFIGNTTGTTLPSGHATLTGDPKLAPLGWYGGLTQSRPPLPASPVIDASDSADPGGTDQRGFPRFFDGDDDGTPKLDLGAAEAENPFAIANFSFEEPELAAGDYTATGNVPGWSATTAFVEHIEGFSMQGSQHLGIENGGTVTCDLSAKYRPNTVYVLQVAVGSMPGMKRADPVW